MSRPFGFFVPCMVGLWSCFLCAQRAGQAPATPASVRPYTAHFKIVRATSGADGVAPIASTSTETFARDSHGRTYEETERPEVTGGQKNKRVSVYVRDPGAGTALIWNSGSNRAVLYLTPAELRDELKGCWADEQGRIQGSGPEEEDWFTLPGAPLTKTTTKAWISDSTGIRKQVLRT